MSLWTVVAAVAVCGIVADCLLSWMHKRGWIYWEGVSLLALGLLACAPGRAPSATVHRERDVVLVPVGDLPPDRYPDRLNSWKREHPRLRVTGMDNLLQYREDSSHVVLVVKEEPQPVAQSFAWHPLAAFRDAGGHARRLALDIGDVLDAQDGPEPFTLVPAYSGGAKGVLVCTTPVVAR